MRDFMRDTKELIELYLKYLDGKIDNDFYAKGKLLTELSGIIDYIIEKMPKVSDNVNMDRVL